MLGASTIHAHIVDQLLIDRQNPCSPPAEKVYCAVRFSHPNGLFGAFRLVALGRPVFPGTVQRMAPPKVRPSLLLESPPNAAERTYATGRRWRGATMPAPAAA